MSEIENSVWDQSTLSKRIYGNLALLETLLNSFINDKTDNIRSLKAAHEKEDYAQIRMTAHTVKGIASQLYGLRLQQVSEEIEQLSNQAVNKNNIALITGLLPKFELEMNTLAEAFEAYLHAQIKTETSDNDKSISEPTLKQLLGEIGVKLAESEYIPPNSINILQTTHRHDDSLHPLLSQLVEQINLFDNDAASATLKEINQHISIGKSA